MDQGVIQHIAIEERGVWGEDKDRALKLAWVSIPVAQEDALPVGSFDQSQKSTKQL